MNKFYADDSILEDRTTAKNSLDNGVLLRLSRSEDTITRIAVAANTATPVSVLIVLSTDMDWGVRAAVAANPRTLASIPAVIRERLKADENRWVAEAAQKL